MIEDLNYMKNFFFKINVELNPKIILFNKLMLLGYSAINWDITKQRWKSKKITPLSHYEFKHTNGSSQIDLAWKFESIYEKHYGEYEY